MIVVLSGEGPTDLGTSGSGRGVSEGQDLLPGPMAWLIDRLVESGGGPAAGCRYSVIDTGVCVLVSKSRLVAVAKGMTMLKKRSFPLPGRKRAKETAYFYENARALAVEARRFADERADDVVAVLFRDADGTAAAGRGLWEDKRRSMENGFTAAGFGNGVPMIPRPKSEAWLLCALRANPYTGCNALEERSGNDRSPRNLKGELAELIGEVGGGELRALLSALVVSRRIDVTKITMPSFVAFRDRLFEVLSVILPKPVG